MLNNQQQMDLLKQAVKEDYKGSIADLMEGISPEEQQENVEVAETPQQQEQGLSGRSSQDMPDAMVFPESQGDFNTSNMQAPIDIDKYGKQGELVQSYKSVPPGVGNLPMGDDVGTVIERPADYRDGGVKKYQEVGVKPYNGGYDAVTENSEDNLANIEWNRQWINSPMHREMLTSEDPENVDAVTQGRLQNLEGITTRTHTQPSGTVHGTNYGSGSSTGILGSSSSRTGDIHLYPSDNKDPNLTNIHEVSHSSDRPRRTSNTYDILSEFQKGTITKEEAEKQLPVYNTIEQGEERDGTSFVTTKEGRLIPSSSQEMINSAGLRNSMTYGGNGSAFQQYLLGSEGTEVRARLNSVRYKAQEAGIYDPFTEKITKEQYEKLVSKENKNLFGWSVKKLPPGFKGLEPESKGGSNELETLRQFFGDKSLMEMLNTISFNPEEDNQNSIQDEMPGESTMAKTGGFFKNSKVNTRKKGGFFNCK